LNNQVACATYRRPVRLDELIENYDEVCSVLHNTRHEWFLDEPLEDRTNLNESD